MIISARLSLLSLIAAGLLVGATPGLGQAGAMPHHPIAHKIVKKSGNKPGKAAPVPPPAPVGPPPVAPLAFANTPAPPELPNSPSYILIDDQTGAVIAEKSPNTPWPPASLTKLMTAYLTYQAIAHGTIKLDQAVPVSVTAWHTGGSRMFISPSMHPTVDQLLHGLIIDSGNDAAVALAQAVAGNRSAFVGLMNHAAAQLQMTGTHYTNVDGLPDPDLHTTATDLGILSRAIIAKYPQFLKISAEKHYTFDKIRQRSWNPVLFRDKTVDGLKTGRTKAAGRCIDATALRNGRRLIAIVLGGPSFKASTNDIEALLDYGYQFYADQTIVSAGKILATAQAPTLEPASFPVGAAKSLVMTLPVNAQSVLKTNVALNGPFKGAIAQGAVVGTITVSANGKTIATVPAVALAAAKPAGFFTMLMRRLHHL